VGIGKVDKGEGSVEGEVWRWSARNLCAVAAALSSGSDGNSPSVSDLFICLQNAGGGTGQSRQTAFIYPKLYLSI